MARVLLCTTPRQPFHTLTALFPDLSPHGLQVLSAVLKRDGHEVRIADVEHLPPYPPLLRGLLDSFRPDVVGFSNNCLPNTPVILQVARRVKADHPGVKLMAGGEVPTQRPEYFLQGEDAVMDAVCIGEAENSVSALAEALTGQRDRAAVPGIAYPDGRGGLRRTPPAPPVADLDSLPMPDWAGTLKPAPFSSGLSASVETARGCPYACSFCSIPGYFGREPRFKSVGRILAELRHLKSLGVTEVSFIDDSFATDIPRAQALFTGMLAEGLGLRFGIQIRADIVARNPGLMALAARAGLFLAVVGFEGYSARALKDANKGSSRAINEAASRLLRGLGVCVYGTHIFGGPGMRASDNLLTFVLGRRNSDVFRMTIYTPLPGSPAFAELERAGRIRTRDPRDYYYGTYVLDDGHDPALVKLGYFGLQLLHYALPGTAFKALAARHAVVRAFNRRAYRGACEFVVGQVLALTGFASEARKP